MFCFGFFFTQMYFHGLYDEGLNGFYPIMGELFSMKNQTDACLFATFVFENYS